MKGTIEENIVYGVNEYTEEELHTAAKLANAYDFIMDKEMFPEGFETKVGSRGSKLSGGQKQRIAIARALIKKPKILIMDEATSSLDVKAEKDIKIAVDHIINDGDMTVILIAHRLSTVYDADEIIVIEEGKIVE